MVNCRIEISVTKEKKLKCNFNDDLNINQREHRWSMFRLTMDYPPKALDYGDFLPSLIWRTHRNHSKHEDSSPVAVSEP